MCGSRPLPEAVTRSTGTAALLSGSAARRASTRSCTDLTSAGFVGLRFEPDDQAAVGLVREHELRDGRHDHRIDDAGDHGESDQQHDGRAQMAHGGLLYTRPSATRIMSTSLMPGNGMRMPPTP